MSLWRQLTHGLRVLVKRRAADQDVTDEVQHYFDQATAAYRARGMSEEAARRAAHLELGNVTAVREQVRSYGWENVVSTVVGDLRYAIRRLWSNPGFTAVAVISLAVGIGANSAIFSLVNATIIRQLAVERPEELVYVNSPSGAFSYPDFAELRANATVFEGPLIAWGGITASIGIGETRELVTGAIVTGDFFNVLGVHATRGRVITPDDDRTPGAHPVVVISDQLWTRSFGKRADIVGQDIRFNGQRFTIIGVVPPEFGGPVLGTQRDLYVPMMMQAIARPPRGGYSGEMNPDLLQNRGNRWLILGGRLKHGVSPAQALAQLEAIVTEQERRNPVADASHGPRAAPASVLSVNDDRVEPRAQLKSVGKLLMSVVGAVLLIACANVANLLLARATTRRKEVAVRLAIGASRGRLLRQLLTESLVLSLAGGLAGLALAWLAVSALRASPPPPGALPVVLDFAIDARVLLFTLALSLFTGILFGFAPALRASRPDLVPALKDNASENERVRRVSGRNALVVLQVGVSLVLLISAGLFLRSFQQAAGVSPGFDTDRVLAAPVNINLLRYTKAQGRQFYRDLTERVAAIPGVESVTLSRWLPLTGGGSIRSIQIEGGMTNDNVVRNEGAGVQAPEGTVNVQTVGMNYFRTLGIGLVRGRDFTVQDDSGSTRVAVVNEEFVHRYFKNADPIGKRFNSGRQGEPWTEIVGVARQSKIGSLSETPSPLVYVPLLQNHETGVVLQVRSSSPNPAGLAKAVRHEMQALEPELPTANVSALSDILATSLYPARMGARVLLGFGGIALLLATIGLYGVMSYTVSRRSRELGIRMALGARPARILQQIVGEGSMLALLGITGGLLAAYFATRLLTSFLYGVSATDPGTYIVIPALLLVVAVVASLLPGLRATRIDPMAALRSE